MSVLILVRVNRPDLGFSVSETQNSKSFNKMPPPSKKKTKTKKTQYCMYRFGIIHGTAQNNNNNDKKIHTTLNTD